MPSLTRAKPDADAIYICLDGFISKHGSYAEGNRVRGDDPGVRAHPEHFVRDGVSDDEYGAARARLRISQAVKDPKPDPRYRILQPIPPERRVRATQTLFVTGGIGVTAGELMDSESDFVKKNRKYFVPDTTAE